jgi:pimeloyl-ACP methyl ester carboxylesterase
MVGHSGGGAAITQAAENCSDRILALVYLTAFLPRNGESVMTWIQQDPESLIHGRVFPVAEGLASVPRELFHEAFYGKCSAEDEAFATPLLMPQATAPLETPVATSEERWGRIRRYYIECAHDRTITLRLQRAMQRLSPCRETYSLDADHSPFFSAPEALVDALDSIAVTRTKG